MKYQEDFKCSLDVHANIVSICVVCHKQIRYGEEKKNLIADIYESRKDRLNKCGISIELDKLLGYYQD
ncbi:hypothetical protein M948_20395 [Virgibacillus sp. CM-4]|uniref:hypothetical protein n=1 Tax=Virgibacillus massiliensis TaxID=1462526 RepID=UPI00038863B3|nr:hypothetical protein [Virgibacillus massiliensis]EQB34751.1 hypothetical protein M948_20395 [Virgibacillus sp. CM-4]